MNSWRLPAGATTDVGRIDFIISPAAHMFYRGFITVLMAMSRMRQSGLIPELSTSLLPLNLKSANPFQERTMKAFRWMLAGAFGVLLISGSPALAQGNSQGHGHGKGHDHRFARAAKRR